MGKKEELIENETDMPKNTIVLKKEKKKNPGLSFDKFVSETGNSLQLQPIQIKAFKNHFSGKILCQSDWEKILYTELNKRA